MLALLLYLEDNYPNMFYKLFIILSYIFLEITVTFCFICMLLLIWIHFFNK